MVFIWGNIFGLGMGQYIWFLYGAIYMAFVWGNIYVFSRIYFCTPSYAANLSALNLQVNSQS